MTGKLRLLNGQRLISPIDKNARPTTSRVREAVMNILAPRLENCNWLDLCSGSGVMACEALTRGAKSVLALEKNKKTAKICENNLYETSKHLDNKKTFQVLSKDVLTWLNFSSHKNKSSIDNQTINAFNIVYFDPPYNSKLYCPVLDALSKRIWTRPDPLVICEHSTNYYLKTPTPWTEIDRRTYGSSSLLFLTLQEECYADTDSKRPQTNQELSQG